MQGGLIDWLEEVYLTFEDKPSFSFIEGKLV